MGGYHRGLLGQSELLEAADVAAMLGMTRGWVYEQARKGTIPHVKLGRYTRFRRESIEGWIRDRERGKIRAI